jgi:D-amino-acid dehydrogenase
MSDSGRVVVIGGGIIGAACAYFLSRAGRTVTVIDRGRFGMGCSHANCGFICPSHVLPLAAPGAILPALRSLFSRRSPFTIKPRFDLALWRWLLKFALRANRRDMIAAGHAIQALLNSSRQLYDEWMHTEPLDCEWQPRGMLFVCKSQHTMEHYAATDAFLRREFALPAERYDGASLTDLEPALKPGLAGGWLYRCDAHLRPDRLLSALHRVLETRGVTILENREATSLLRDRHTARAVRTPTGEIEASAFVAATGAWTPLLANMLGYRAPIQPGKGYSITMPRPARCPKLPLIFEEHRVAITPMESGYRIGSTMEFAGYDPTLNRDRLSLLRESARLYLHEPEREPIEEEWYGWRPMTCDGLPIIGRTPAFRNVWIAAGHSMLGMAMAPATGRLVAELVTGAAPHVDPRPYAIRS